MEKLHKVCVWTLIFLSLMITKIRSQPLLDNDHKKYTDCHDLNMEGPKNVMSDTETLLKETELKLDEEQRETDSIHDSYDDLLKMYERGIVPNDTTIDGICARNSRFISNTPDECQTYYDCSGVRNGLSGWVKPYNFWPSINKYECYYPFAFSDKTLQCENYTKVECGTRHLPTWECGYFREKCHLSHCIPCEIRYPNCENKTDGLWPQSGRLNSPYYMICKDERLVSKGYCPKDNEWNVTSYPYQGKCVHQYAIPQQYYWYGRLPSCSGKIDGNYQFPERPCDAFYKCINGTSTAVKCPNNTFFDIVKRICEVGGKCI